MLQSFIRALYDPEAKLTEEPEFYKRVLADRESVFISPTLYYLLKQRSLLEQTPHLFREQIKRRFEENVCLNMFIRRQMEGVLARLEQERIEVIPLKGTRLAEVYFGHVGARTTSDIDLLVRRQDVERAGGCIRAAGFGLEQRPARAHFHKSFSKVLPYGSAPLTVELHWGVLRERTSELCMETFWEQSIPSDSYTYVRELSPEHTFYHLCLHGWSHKMASIKYYLDLLQLIHTRHEQLQYERLFREAAAHGTLTRILRTLTRVYERFPHVETVLPLYLRKSTHKAVVSRLYYELLDFDSAGHAFASWAGALYGMGSKISPMVSKEIGKKRS